MLHQDQRGVGDRFQQNSKEMGCSSFLVVVRFLVLVMLSLFFHGIVSMQRRMQVWLLISLLLW